MSKDSTSVSVHKRMIGPMLLAEGVVTRAQLEEAVAKQKKYPQFTIGQIISFMFGVPRNEIDRISMEKLIVPASLRLLQNRLQKIASGDRFVKGMEIESFVTGIYATPMRYVNTTVESHAYDFFDKENTAVTQSRHVESRVQVKVAVHTLAEEIVYDVIDVYHNSVNGELTIEQSDEQLKGSVYFGIRSNYTTWKESDSQAM